MSDAFIVDAIRSPIGKLGGSLSKVRADDLGAHVIRELVSRNNSLDPAAVEEVVFGCANQAGEDNRNVARMSALLAGLPWSVPGETVNRLCASGMSSTVIAARAIKSGDAGDIYISGGVENMTRAPFVMSKGEKAFSGKVQIHDTTLGWRFVNPKMKEMYGTHSMGQTAENLVEKFGISRGDQDKFAAASQNKAAASRESGRLAKEIVSVSIPQRKADPIIFAQDEFIRPGTTPEILGKLRAVFRTDGQGSVTAGNSSGLNDGACALLIASEQGMKDQNLTPRARIVASAVAGVEPRIMGIGPVGASQKALKRAGLSLSDIAVIELNEAFAAQSLAVLRELGIADDDPRVNPNGGAIALGHPLGMSGARLLQTALHELEERNERFALCTLCVGVGQGMATIIERV